MTSRAIIAPRVLTPDGLRDECAVLIRGGRIEQLVDAHDVPPGYTIERHMAGTLVPGFVDLQVNGGGGVLFNDQPTVDGIATIAAAHRQFGTTAMLPTLISDNLDVVAQAITAVDAAIEQGVPGVLGIHIEGPFLNVARKGIHDASKFATLDEAAVDLLSSLRHGKTLVTLAPECTTPAMIARLVERGVVVAAGHTTASYDVMAAAIDAGLTGVTHLFNAMPPLSGRDPGVIGSALTERRVFAGIIADGYHVAASNLRLALAAKGADRLCLVSDAMPSVGTDLDRFHLGDVEILVQDGRCVDAAGTLAGCHLDMASALRGILHATDCTLEQACFMASSSPANFLALSEQIGSIEIGRDAAFNLMDDDLAILKVVSHSA